MTPTRLPRPWPTWLLLAGLAVWLWPIGLGGKMPVGGDVTQFSIGLMAVLQRALRSLRLPLWNDLWGYGFPGLAESQMGVYYPPHWLLYGLLPTEAAYTASLVLHTFWAGLGASWAARRFGASRAAAALGGFVWGTSGFFVNHLTHQWGYTTGSWMPWAWGLAWGIARGRGGRRDGLTLAAVLALQVFPGHFQLAFITQTGVLAITFWGLIDRGREPEAPEQPSRPLRSRWGGLVVMLAWLAAGFLTACQLVPTWELAQRAETDRTWEYLSGFAYSPIHLVSYVAPGLFHRSPLWRPLAWDPFHNSPEECLAYVGLVPLWLAWSVFWREWRRNPAVRILAFVGGLSLILSLGPYVPGFSYLIQLPGFSFFRAPARWGLATMLALSLLAALGFDRVRTWTRVRPSLLRFAILAAIGPLLCVAAVELALASTAKPGMPAVANGFERLRQFLPWSRVPNDDEPSFHQILTQIRRSSDNPIVLAALGRRGLDRDSRFDRERWSIYREELGESAALLIALAALALLAWKPRAFVVGLVALTAADLLLFGRHRDVDLGSIRSLVEQSPVLQRLAEEAQTTRGRVISPLGNLPMLAGAAPVPAYRTLDIPVLPWLGQSVALPIQDASDMEFVADAMHMAGATVRIVPPGQLDERIVVSSSTFQTAKIADPTLAGWLSGKRAVTQNRHSNTFQILKTNEAASRAWLFSQREAAANAPDVSHPTVLSWFGPTAHPLPWLSEVPEHLVIEEIEVPTEAESGDLLVIVSQLNDPEWHGVWIGPGGEQPAEIRPVFGPPLARTAEGSWQRVVVPGPGRWTLHLSYEGHAARFGLAVSAVAWTVWLAAWLAPWIRSRHRQRTDKAPTPSDP